jgi:hypothetical protein
MARPVHAGRLFIVWKVLSRVFLLASASSQIGLVGYRVAS